MVDSCTDPESSEKTWFPIVRKYAVDLSKNPMIVSTRTSTGSGAGSAGSPIDFRDFLPFLFSGNMRVTPSMQAYVLNPVSIY